ncbi:CPBP family intramembrane glutamic endopeptidase [Paludisphaera rhizosphaerae]|uniref:CPBP family intramembrane glutamic endopeptidase n=1 Tax=Paludisphaera rhizosphaerae TaxID=2711216 RepID=UPI0013EA645D|nr:CPBP family intramembrane glutamic endopeptidase [Paludisphaera rhizosphaerae]
MTPPLYQGYIPLAVALHVQQGLLSVVSILLLSMLAGMLLYSMWAVLRLALNLPILPRPPFVRLQPAVWGLGAILTIIALYIVTSQAATLACRELLGIRVEEALKAYHGKAVEKAGDEAPPAAADAKEDAAPASEPAAEPKAEVAKETEASDPAAEPKAEVAKETDRHADDASNETAAAARDLMTLNTCHILIFLSAFPWFFRRCSRVGLEALGLTTRRLPEQILTGFIAALIATPVVYIVQFLAVRFFSPESHPVEKMMKDHFSPATAILAFVSAVVLAPIAEETLFRGVLQGWLSRVFRNPFVPPEDSDTDELNEVCWPAVVLTSALFAALHIAQWPAPIPLFFFAMILGVVYQRTGSLLTAITMHGVFNGFSTLMMLVQQLGADLRQVEDIVPAPAATIWNLLNRLMEVLG